MMTENFKRMIAGIALMAMLIGAGTLIGDKTASDVPPIPTAPVAADVPPIPTGITTAADVPPIPTGKTVAADVPPIPTFYKA